MCAGFSFEIENCKKTTGFVKSKCIFKVAYDFKDLKPMFSENSSFTNIGFKKNHLLLTFCMLEDLHAFIHSFSVPDILMITVPIFKHRGGHGNEQFEAQKLIKKIVPSKSIVVNGEKLALSGIITHLGDTTLDEGHFVADILTDSEDLHCDDKTISNDISLSDSGYIFIYSKSNQVQPAKECTGTTEEIQCESCKKPLIITSILRHIALNKKCKAEVSPEFMSYVKDLVVKHRKSMWAKNYQNNKDGKRSKMSEWNERNKESQKEKMSEWYKRNKEEVKQKRSESYERNRESQKGKDE